MKSPSQSRILCLFLIAALVFPALLLVSCSENNQNSPSSDASQTEAAVEAAVTDDPRKVRPALPESNFSGYNFRIFVRDDGSADPWGPIEAATEALNGEVMNDAVYNRNRELEESLHITVTQIPNTDVRTAASNSIMAGEDAFDCMMSDMFTTTALAQVGSLMNLNSMNYFDFNKIWWDQSALRDLTIGNKLYFITGDFSYKNHNASWVYLFNKKMITDYQLENPYELVSSGKWTIQKFAEMLTDISDDLNGDGKMSKEDLYGLITEQSNTLGMFFGAQNFVISKDGENYPEITIYTERAVSTLDTVLAFMLDTSKTVSIQSPFISGWDDLVDIFQDDRGLFYSVVMYTIKKLRNMPTDFGVLPMPKYDEPQKAYYTWTSPWIASPLSIPVTVKDLDRTAIILEELCYQSYVLNNPAYYEASLQGKFTRDTESAQMLDIIFGNRVYDLAMVYDWGGLGFLINDMTSNKKNNFASEYEKIKETAQTALDKTNGAYKALP